MLALIAGTGDLPAALVARLPAPPLICAMDGFAPAMTADVTFRIEQLGSFLSGLRARGVTEICLAGAIRRPPIDPAAVDAATRPLVPRIMAAIAQGDDGALRAIIAILEDAGLTVRAAHEIAPDLLPDAGVLSRKPVTTAAHQDAAIAEQTIAEMGRADIGQACVVGNGQVLAREGQAGTDAMLDRLAAQGRGGKPGPADAAFRGAILFKAPKPGQDRRADLPVIGPQTARRAIAAGLAGIVIAHDGVMVLDQDRVLSALDEAGLFLWVRRGGRA